MSMGLICLHIIQQYPFGKNRGAGLVYNQPTNQWEKDMYGLLHPEKHVPHILQALPSTAPTPKSPPEPEA
jgi:hypothetical protein